MRACNRKLVRIARAVLKNDGEAEEALQAAYTTAFVALSSFRGKSALTTRPTLIVE